LIDTAPELIRSVVERPNYLGQDAKP